MCNSVAGFYYLYIVIVVVASVIACHVHSTSRPNSRGSFRKNRWETVRGPCPHFLTTCARDQVLGSLQISCWQQSKIIHNAYEPYIDPRVLLRAGWRRGRSRPAPEVPAVPHHLLRRHARERRVARLRVRLAQDDARRTGLLLAADRALDLLDHHDVGGTAARARAALAEVLASPAHASAHRVAAVGHAHIDSAWLWPVRETVRKFALEKVAPELLRYDLNLPSLTTARGSRFVSNVYPLLYRYMTDCWTDG